jgi:hypothetical protein
MHLLASILLLSLSQVSAAQPSTIKLALKATPEIKNGKIAMVEGATELAGHLFVVESLTILQPVTITVIAKNAADDIRLELFKYFWDKPAREGSTKVAGHHTFKIRTQGELGIVVTSAQERRPYQLIVWAGDEVRPPMKPVLVSTSRYRKQSSQASISGGTLQSLLLFTADWDLNTAGRPLIQEAPC